jgi:flagellar L-ring protein precursor FlgH
MNWRAFSVCGIVSVITMAAGVSLNAAPQKPTDNYDELYRRYLVAARTQPATPSSEFAWMSGLMLDQRARNVNDIVTIRVMENISASGSADASLAKKGSGSAAVSGAFGLEKKVPSWMDPGNLAGTKTSTDFQGSGTTTRSSTLTAAMTARVTEVLPNGDLVIEGIREIEVNGDRQVVVLTGVARGADLGPNNTVASPLIAQLRIRYFGRGLMKDNLQPGWLIRLLNKIF